MLGRLRRCFKKMTFDFAAMVKADFEDFLLNDLGETVSYYPYTDNETLEATYGYLLERPEPAATTVSIIIATFTQKDKQEFNLGNYSIDDHKAYIPDSITPKEGDEILRGDGERYEVVKILHEHAIGGTVGFYSVHIRRRNK